MNRSFFRKILLFGIVPLLMSYAVAHGQEQGKLTRDLTVGSAHDIHLTADQVVQVLKRSGTSAVILVQLPDGSNGVYQIDASAVESVAPGTPSAPTPSTAALTNSPPAPSAPAPVAATAPPPPTPAPAIPPSSAGPPTYPDDFVGGSEVVTTDGTRAAGTASVVKLKGGTQSYILSARHLLGPEGGFKKETAAADVPAFVQSISIHAFSGGIKTYNLTGLLVPSKRLKPIGGAPIDDLAVYLNKDAAPQSQAVALAETVPAVGDPVWVIARVRGGVPEGQVVQSGRVTFNTKFLVFQFDNDNIVTAGASGAPVLNAAGEVVGVYSGHGTEGGHVTGFVVPSPLIVSVIKQSGSSNP